MCFSNDNFVLFGQRKSSAVGEYNKETPWGPCSSLLASTGISEGRAQAEANNCPVNMAPQRRDQTSVPTKPHKPSSNVRPGRQGRPSWTLLGASTSPPSLCLPQFSPQGPGGADGPPRQMLRAVGSCLRSPNFCLCNIVVSWTGRRNSWRDLSASSLQPPPSSFFDFASVGVTATTSHARCHQTASISARKRCRPPS